MKISFTIHFKWNRKFRKKKQKMVLQFISEEAKLKWDDIEIHPIAEDENGYCEVVDEGQENFWSVYLHQVNGGLRCIADLPTKNDAQNFEKLLKEVVKTGNHIAFQF